jgi:hypothetical protein
MSVDVAGDPAARDWWLRTLLVLQAPRVVFVALHDDSDEAASERAEPVLLLAWLAGAAGALATPTAAHLMDSGDYDGLLVVIWVVIAGALSGITLLWALGALLWWGGKMLGSQGSYRRARHVLAFASAPLALSLVLWPVKLALYGGDLFRSGGPDAGTGGQILGYVQIAFLVWAVALLVVGVRTVHGWTWARGAAAVALAAVPAGVLFALLF